MTRTLFGDVFEPPQSLATKKERVVIGADCCEGLAGLPLEPSLHTSRPAAFRVVFAGSYLFELGLEAPLSLLLPPHAAASAVAASASAATARVDRGCSMTAQPTGARAAMHHPNR